MIGIFRVTKMMIRCDKNNRTGFFKNLFATRFSTLLNVSLAFFLFAKSSWKRNIQLLWRGWRLHERDVFFFGFVLRNIPTPCKCTQTKIICVQDNYVLFWLKTFFFPFHLSCAPQNSYAVFVNTRPLSHKKRQTN